MGQAKTNIMEKVWKRGDELDWLMMYPILVDQQFQL